MNNVYFRPASDNHVLLNFDHWKHKTYKKIAFICGGTGITPIFQILQNCAINNESFLKLYLIFGNKTNNDILLYKEIEELKCKLNLETCYTLEQMIEPTNPELKQKMGLITEELIQSSLPLPSDDLLIMLCGSKTMTRNYLEPILMKLNYKNIFLF